MKRTILLIGLGVAFLAVSLWVALSGGRSAKAVRAKFRLGGAILTITSALTAASCEQHYMVSCYDPSAPPTNQLYLKDVGGETNSISLRNGDIIIIGVYCEFDAEATVAICDAEGKTLQSELVELNKEVQEIEFTVNVGDYRGEAAIVLTYALYNSGDDTTASDKYPITIE